MKTEAIEKLREKVREADARATTNPLWKADLDELRTVTQPRSTGWQNPYPAGDPRALLKECQFPYFHDRTRFKILLASRQIGKDFTSEGEIVEDCLHRPGTDWMVGAPSERQALDSLNQAKDWAAGFDFAIAQYNEEREGGSESLLKAGEVIFPNKSRIRAVPGRPDTVRGRSTNIFLTEFDFFEDPSATWRAILPSVTNPLRGGEKKVRLVSTPNGKGGQMHRIWTKDDRGRMHWARWKITIYHAVAMGLPIDIEVLQEAMDDPEGWAQEFECEFLDGSNVLLPYDVIALAESIEATEVISDFWDAKGLDPIVLGIDFGRTHDPMVCWAIEQKGDTWWTREVLAERGMPTPEQERVLSQRIARARRVCFDYTGPGIGLGDYLVERFGEWKPEEHKFGKIELCTFTTGLKREMFPKLRRAFEAPTRVRIPISVTIREDLHEMRQIVRNGEYNYQAPRTAEGHSDRCTALALAWRATQDIRGPFQYRRVRARNSRRDW